MGMQFIAVGKTKEQKHYAITFIVIQKVFLPIIVKTFHSAACKEAKIDFSFLCTEENRRIARVTQKKEQ